MGNKSQALKDKKKDSDTIESRLANSKFSLESDYDYDSLPSNKELEDSGLSLRDYLDKNLRKGKPRKKPAMKKGGDVAKYAFGGSVRGSGCATKGTRPAKMVTMKGS